MDITLNTQQIVASKHCNGRSDQVRSTVLMMKPVLGFTKIHREMLMISLLLQTVVGLLTICNKCGSLVCGGQTGFQHFTYLLCLPSSLHLFGPTTSDTYGPTRVAKNLSPVYFSLVNEYRATMVDILIPTFLVVLLALWLKLQNPQHSL